MPAAQLIEEIVRKVLAEKGLSSAGPARTQGPRCLVLARQGKSDPAVLEAALPKGACPVFLNREPLPLTDDYDRIFLPWLSLGAMADLALGRASGRTERRILDLLMKGRRIEVLAYEYDGFEQTAPQPLYDVYETYEATLDRFGLCRYQALSGRSRRVRTRLLTETAVADLAGQGVSQVMIGPDCMVTALARDLAREKGIRISIGVSAGKGGSHDRG